ncbi:hypothetical protein ACI7RC_12430 [Brevibacillus sp. B_LB10_24]
MEQFGKNLFWHGNSYRDQFIDDLADFQIAGGTYQSISVFKGELQG